ncbi:PREDICTED: synergin gamma isoform X1 [Pseudopodoces humilis]|uniref:synergin gamma isoform X1 n=1 Tax=Pseudopodoces humilis TaxID=181119 RepID=UPI0006B73B1A|nr:PREDICTED: synergin gamma isoform X1 [Pseudopodoces humilis]XP_014110489.1 PREDICTED: synergin gamma isoform X1 [Pseudopodoces humilis]
MALRPGPGAGGAGGAGGGAAGAASFMFPVAGGLGPPQGMIPMQQQGFPMVPVMQTNMPGMMGMNYGSQMPPGPMTMQGGMALGPMPAAGMPYMGQASFLGMRPAAPQYSPDMQKQFAEEQQKRFEHQQKFLEEERKRRQFEEQKQKLRLLSSVKPKTGEKSRDDALEAIKGNLDGFSRDAKMHPTPATHPKKTDHPTPSHCAVSVSHSAFLDDEEFSDFMQGPVETPKLVPQSTSQPFHPATEAGQLLSERAVLQPVPPAQAPVLSTLHGTTGQVPYFPTSASPSNTHKTGYSLEEKALANGPDESEQEQTKLKTSEVGHKASAASQAHPSLTSSDWDVVGGHESGPTAAAEVHKASEQNRAVEECGVGVFPPQDPIQPIMPPWIYNDSLVPELYKKILETTLTPAGIDTAKLYPILMSSGLPRETLGQIWALANRTTPGKLTKEELYCVLAMIAVTQRGIPAVSPDVLNQFPAAPVPTLSGLPVPLPGGVSQPPLLPAAPPAPVGLGMGPSVMGMSIPGPAAAPAAAPAPAPAGGAAAQPSGAFLPSYPPGQVVKPEDDDFQEFQDASKSGSLDDSFTDFQGDAAKATSSQHRSSVPSLLMPVPGTKPLSPADKYAVFKGMAAEKPSESAAAFGDGGDKYSAFRELEQPAESKYLGENLAEFKPTGADDGFTDFKTADSISPLEPPSKDKTFPAPFPPLPAQPKQPAQAKTPLNLADLELFSSPGENKQPSFPPAFNASKPGSFPPPPLPPASAQPAPGKTSSLADDFGEFNLFGEFSNGASASGQDDFADFMAFNNGGGFSEQKPDDKYNALKLEASPGAQAASSASTVKGGQSSATTATPTKYDIFKQLSLEGAGAGFEEAKDSALSSAKSDDDFADFHSNKFSSSGAEKSLVDKVAAFKQAKEDSASVKSLDLPSIGGSSVGKEDSEDALSVQFDMKLADVGGDLKHVMSDSSLDLPTVSGQHPPAADVDDLKGGPFGSCHSGSAVSSLASYDWSGSDRDDVQQGKKLSCFAQPAGSGSSAATSVLQKKETLFGSSENITMTTVSKVTTFSSEDALQDVSFAAFANFKDSGPVSSGPSDDDVGDFGDFARLPSEAQEAAAADTALGADFLAGGSSELRREAADDFGEFQSEKPKISKFDFLVATSQGKVKSSEEMIKSELATFDLSVQGSHKRSLSLGDREITRSSPLPALEQPFRDRSNTLSEKPALPVIRDKYKDLTGEVEESERYAYEWQRCLESALQVIKKANDTLNGISSSSVCTEVIQSAQGMEYLQGVVEVYRVTKRVELGIKATAVCSEKLQQLLKDIDKVWNNLISFMSLAALTPDENSLDFSSCMLRPGIKNAQDLACGVCLLNVDSRSKKEEKPVEELPKKAFNSETDNFKLAYGGHQYHASCANFWINCVEPKPPGLILPDLL